jgi:hypothetical protein
MAHFAKIENNKVTDVIFIANENCGGGDYPESEVPGQQFIASLGLTGQWLQTSYNTFYKYDCVYNDEEPPQMISETFIGSEHANGGTPFRGTYAGVGISYDPVQDVFYYPKENPA